MNQTTAILILAVVGTALYTYCAAKNRKKPRVDELLKFAMWCSAVVAGCYMLLSALNLTKQTDEETKRAYVGIFGLVLMVWSLLNAHEMVRAVLVKKRHEDKLPD